MDFGPQVSEKGIRDQAVALGLNPDDAVASSLGGVLVRDLWDRLVAAAPSGRGDDRIANAKLRFSPTLGFAAITTQWKSRYTVRVHLGIVEALAEVANTVVGLDPDFRTRDEGEQAIRQAGVRIAHVLGWLTSVARHVVTTPEHDLTAQGATVARGITIGGASFVLAHELAHVAAGDGRAVSRMQAHRQETAADDWALNLLRRVQTSRHPDAGAVTVRTVKLSTDTTLPAAAMFLSFEGLRQRIIKFVAAADNFVPDGATLETLTETATHPSPYTRLMRLLDQARLDDPDGSEALGVQFMIDIFDALLPEVRRNLPEHVLDTATLREMWRDAGASPAKVEDGASMTWGELYRTQLIGVLREAGRRGHLDDDELAFIMRAVTEMPRPSIDTLAAAFGGNLLRQDDPDRESVHALARTLPDRLSHPFIRRAITGAQFAIR